MSKNRMPMVVGCFVPIICPECGSKDTSFDEGDGMFDCHACGIFFNVGDGVGLECVQLSHGTTTIEAWVEKDSPLVKGEWTVCIDKKREKKAGEKCLQESPEKKEEWLLDAKRRIPEGTRVIVVGGDVDEYIGKTGKVIGYDVGIDGEWPTVRVEFDKPIPYRGSKHLSKHDGFYCDGCSDDEIMKVEVAK